MANPVSSYLSSQVAISNGCFANAPLDNDLINDWNSLDNKDPVFYHNFVQKWGTHLINGITTGSRIKFYSTSKATNQISEVNFTAKLCAGYTGVDAKANACASITADQKSQAGGSFCIWSDH